MQHEKYITKNPTFINEEKISRPEKLTSEMKAAVKKVLPGVKWKSYDSKKGILKGDLNVNDPIWSKVFSDVTVAVTFEYYEEKLLMWYLNLDWKYLSGGSNGHTNRDIVWIIDGSNVKETSARNL